MVVDLVKDPYGVGSLTRSTTNKIEVVVALVARNWKKMLSPETLESYRRMTPGERLRLTIELMQGVEKSLLSGTPEQVNRKFELIRKENDMRNHNMLTAIARSRGSSQ